MDRFIRRALTLASTAVFAVGLVAFPGAAQAGPGEDDPAVAQQVEAEEQLAPLDAPVMPAQVDDLPPLEEADGELPIAREPNKATEQIPPAAPLDPAAGVPDIAMEPVVPAPPVAPEALELPTAPAQDLIDATANDALATLDAAGRLDAAGVPDLDAVDLQPQVSSAQVVDGTVPATVEELIAALTSGNLPPDLGVDPLALLEALPDGIPRVTYRVCSESATKEVECSLTLPLGVPAIVDATGDGTPDVLADLLPAVAVDEVAAAVTELTEAQTLLDETQTRLDNLLVLMEDPVWLALNPWAIVEALELESLVETLTADVAEKLTALLNIIHVGLAMLEVRLPTSEFAGEDLPAHVWAVYDIPGANRLSIGYDGYRRGDSLSSATLGVFTFSPFAAVAGEYDISADLVQVGAGDAMAVTAGLSQVADTDEGEAVDPTVASARFSPVPTLFSVDVEVKPATEDHDQIARVDSNSDVATHLDALVLANERTGENPEDRFVQASIDQVPTEVNAQLTWTEAGDRAALDYTASAAIDSLLFADYTYAAGTSLVQATEARAAALPAVIAADLATEDAGAISLDYTADSRLASLDVNYFDLAGAIVMRGGLDDLPTALTLRTDTGSGRVLFDAAEALGQARVDASFGLAEYPPAEGDHATLVTSGSDLGVSAQVSGMRTVDAYFDAHPRLTTVFEPGGQAFHAEGNLDGVHKARADLSNLPAEATLDIDTAAQQLRYAASEVIELARVDYTNTESGPTVVAAVHDVPATVALDYEMGETPRLLYEASSAVPLVQFFASFDHIEQLDATGDEYLSARIDQLPSTIDVGIDFPARHMAGVMSSELGGIDVVARFGLEDRVWTGAADIDGVPTEFDADWAGGTIRARGITGAIDAIDLTASNHANPTAPQGLRLAAHYTESTGDIDAAVSTRNLTLIEYADTGETQAFQLDTDTGGDPVFVDIDVLLADPQDASVDDLRLALLGRVDNLPSTLNVHFSGDRLSYTADRNIGLLLHATLGKVAALDGLGAPLYGNGVAAVARTCGTGPGCAADETPFCRDQGCLGLVATVNLQGLPTEVAVDFATRTVELDDYAPPVGTLEAYVRLIGMIDDLPDLRAHATLTGLPSPVDFTVGPITVGGGTVDVAYDSSAPLGDLALDVDAATTHEDFPVLRARAALSGVPQTFDLAADLGARTEIAMTNAGPVERLALTVTGDDEGYVDAVLDGLPAEVDVVVDTPNSVATGVMSEPLGSIRMLANNMPFEDDLWGAWLDITGVPAGFTVEWGGGSYLFEAAEGELGRAAAAVTNHDDALAPTGSHFALGYRESNGDIDASASVSDVSRVAYSTEGDNQHFDLGMDSQTITVDANVVFAAGGEDDTRLALAGTLETPDGIDVLIREGRIDIETAGPNLAVNLQAKAGKVQALEGLGSPIYDNGVAARVAGCESGTAGCSGETRPEFCEFFDSCWAAVASVHLPGLPTGLTIDLAGQQTIINGIESPGAKLELFVDLQGVLADVPSTAGKITLDDLPDLLDLTVGPYQFGAEGCFDQQGQWTEMCLAYTASDTVGALTAQMQADTAQYGEYRGKVTLDPVPRSLEFTGTFGQDSEIRSVLGESIDNLEVRATAVDLAGIPDATGSALVRLQDIPTDMTIDIDGFGNGDDVGVPTTGYSANAGTLDGLAAVEADLVQGNPDPDNPITGAGNVALSFTDLGSEFAMDLVALQEDPEQHAVLMESPEEKTGNITVGATVDTSFEMELEDQLIWEMDCGGDIYDIRIDGRIAMPTIRIDNFELEIDGLSDLLITSDQTTKAFVGAGFSGVYDWIEVNLDGVELVPDIDLNVYDELVGIPSEGVDIVFDESDTVTGVYPHVSDLEWRLAGFLNFSNLPGETPVWTNPGLIAWEPTLNHATLDPEYGQQVLTLIHLDPFPVEAEDEDFPTVLVQVLTQYLFDPFADPEPEEPDCTEE